MYESTSPGCTNLVLVLSVEHKHRIRLGYDNFEVKYFFKLKKFITIIKFNHYVFVYILYLHKYLGKRVFLILFWNFIWKLSVLPSDSCLLNPLGFDWQHSTYKFALG